MDLQIGVKETVYSAFIVAWEQKMLTGALLSVGAFFFDTVNQAALVALFMLVIFDFISGIIATVKTGHGIESRKVVRSAFKLAVYFMFVSSGHFTEMAVPLPFIEETIIGFLAVTELISIMENLGRAGYPVPQKLLLNLNDYKSKR